MAGEGSPDGHHPVIPDRVFFRIGDVSQIAGVEAHVLRFWESEFPTLKPRKTSSGQRQYRRKDVETVLRIRHLLYEEGYTIAGARKALRNRRKAQADDVPDDVPTESPAGASAPGDGLRVPSEALREIRSRLEQILELLSP